MSMQTSDFIVLINQWDIVIKCVAFNDNFISLCPVFLCEAVFLAVF